MNKPIIFLSHSSADKNYLEKLKLYLNEKTGGTLQIFLSSDGQSIPFGKNWVHSIEEALDDSKLMFVIISPNSINSKWIYFEAGFAYSKKMKVIPIGINGIDLNQLLPPLNLLQGFNINSEGGLNNLISIVNQEFSSTHKESFTNEEYRVLCSYSDIDVFKVSLLNDINYIGFHISEKQVERSELFEFIAKFLEKGNRNIGKDISQIYIPGIRIMKINQEIYIHVDPFSLRENLAIIKEIYQEIYSEISLSKRVDLFVIFNENIEGITDMYKVSYRLKKSNLKISSENEEMMEYENLLFKITRTTNKWKLDVSFFIEDLDEIPIVDLIEVLFENNVFDKIDSQHYFPSPKIQIG